MSKVLIGLQFKGKNVESVGIYDLSKDKLEMITTKKAKELYTGEELVVENADFNFFINSVNTHIGEQEQYPVIFENKNGEKTIEDGVIIYDIDKTQDNCYKTLLVSTSQVQQLELTEAQLKDLYNSGKYKCNFLVENDLLKIVYKEDGQQKELTEDLVNEDLFNMFNSWYKIKDGRMEKVKDCNVSSFEVKQGEKIIDGFANSDIIEEVDLSGATFIAPKAFYNCKNLKKVILSESLERIGTQAFAKCPNLKELSIPANCSYVGIKIFDNGTVYLQNDLSKYKDIITPFGPKTEIILNKKNSQNDTELKVAYNSDETYLYFYNIDLTGLRKELYIKDKIKLSDIDFMDSDNYINYKDGQVLQGSEEDFIICGKVGKEYLIIKNKLGDWSDSEISQASFEELKESNSKPTNGTYSKSDIIPLNPAWGWFNIKITNSDVNSKVGAQLTEITDTGDILSSEQKMIMADYINKKFESKYGKIILGKAKANKKSQEEKDKFPGYEWVFGGQFPGGVKCDNPGKLNRDTGKIEYKDSKGNYYCYFGHTTYNHLMAKGYKDGKLMKTFTFGIKCASDFLNIDIGALSKIKEFQGILTEAINQVTDVIKNKSYADYIKKFKRFYEIIQVVKTADKFELLGPYGDIAKRCVSSNTIVPKVVMSDIIDYIKSENTHYDIYTLCIKNRKNLDIIYNYPTLIDLSTNEQLYKVRKSISSFIDETCYESVNEAYLDYKSLSDVNKRVNELKVDEEEYKKIEQLRQEFDKMELGRGKYVLEDSFYINADECKIVDFSQCNRQGDSNEKELCSFEKKASSDLIEFFNDSNNIDRSTKRPTGGDYPLYESKYIRQAKILKDLLDIENIPDNKIRIITYMGYSNSKPLNRKDFIALAYKNNLYGYGTGNQAKPFIFYKDGKFNYLDEQGLIPTMKSAKLYTKFFTDGINNIRAYLEIDYDTSNFKLTSVNKLNGIVNVTDKDSQAYKDLIKNKDFDKMHLMKSYTPGVLDSVNNLLEKLEIDKNQNVFIISKIGNVRDDKDEIRPAFDYFLQKEGNSIKLYLGCVASEQECYIPFSKLSDMGVIAEIKDDKVIKQSNTNLFDKGCKYVIKYEGQLSDDSISKLNKEMIERKKYANTHSAAIDEVNKDIYEFEKSNIKKNNKLILEYTRNYAIGRTDLYFYNWNPSIDYNNQNRKNISVNAIDYNDFNKTLENAIKQQEKIENQKQETEDRYSKIEKEFEELKSHKDLWQELKFDTFKLSQFDSYRKRSFDYVLDNVDKCYKKLQKHLGIEIKENSTSSQKCDIIFVKALKDNLADLDRWIGNSNYKGAYEQLSKKIINNEPLIGNQYRIVNHIKSDLGKYLNCKF